MWIKKTSQEIEETEREEAKPTNLSRWLGYSMAGVFLLIPVFFNVGRLTWRPGPFVRPMDDVMKELPAMVFLFLLVVLFMQLFKLPIVKKKKVVICPKCEAPKDDDGDYECPCGGRFVDIKSMKWVE